MPLKSPEIIINALTCFVCCLATTVLRATQPWQAWMESHIVVHRCSFMSEVVSTFIIQNPCRGILESRKCSCSHITEITVHLLSPISTTRSTIHWLSFFLLFYILGHSSWIHLCLTYLSDHEGIFFENSLCRFHIMYKPSEIPRESLQVEKYLDQHGKCFKIHSFNGKKV